MKNLEPNSHSSIHDLPIERPYALRHRSPRKVGLRIFATSLGGRKPQCSAKKKVKAIRYRGNTLVREDQFCVQVLHHLRQPAYRSNQDRGAAGQRFQGGQPEAF